MWNPVIYPLVNALRAFTRKCEAEAVLAEKATDMLERYNYLLRESMPLVVQLIEKAKKELN